MPAGSCALSASWGETMSKAGSRIMLSDESTSDSPRALIYRQLDRLFVARIMGQGGGEALEALRAMLNDLKDKEWYVDMKRIREENGDVFWSIVAAVIGLLNRNNIGLRTPRRVEPGKEFLEAV